MMLRPAILVGLFAILAIPAVPQSAAQHVASDDAETSRARAAKLYVRGLTEAHRGDHESAIQLFDQASRISPDEPAIFHSLSESHGAMGRHDVAIFYAERAASLSSDPSYLHNLARSLIRGGQPKRARDVYTRLVDTHPDNTDALFELARLNVHLGLETEAAEAFEQLIRRMGDDRLLRTRLLQLYGRLDDDNGIERTIRALIELEPETAQYYLLLSDFLVRRGRTPEAIATLEQGRRAVPESYEVVADLLSLYRQSGRSSVADSLSASITEIDGLSTDQIKERAEHLYLMSGSDSTAFDAAVELLERGLEAEPSDRSMLIMLGDLEYRRGRYEASATHLSRALEIDPRDPDVWVQASLAYFNAGKAAEGARLGEEGILLFPGQVELIEITAHCYLVLYRNSRSIELYEEALRLLQDDELWNAALATEAHASLGFLYARRKDFERSDQHYAQAIKVDSTNTFALNNYAFSLADRNTNLPQALTMAQQAVDREPDNASFLDTLGWIHFLLDNPDDALRFIQRAAESPKASPLVIEHLGDVYRKLGRIDEAEAQWRRSLEMNPTNTALIQKLGGNHP